MEAEYSKRFWMAALLIVAAAAAAIILPTLNFAITSLQPLLEVLP